MKNPIKKDIPSPEDSPGSDDLPYPKRMKKIISRKKLLYPKPTRRRRIFPDSEENTINNPVQTPEETKVNEETERLLQKIKMEITFSDKSTIEKEILLTDKNTAEKKVITFDENSKEPDLPADVKIPRVTAAILAVIVCASLITGVYHWYTSYFKPADNEQPIHTDAGAGADNTHIGTDIPEQTGDKTEEQAPVEPETPVINRPDIEPFPEFLALWEEYGNDDIVAVLRFAEMEFHVMQSSDNAFYITHDIFRNYSSQGWVFLDHQVDLLTGMEHNMVVYDPVGSFIRETIQEYADYDFFLMHPKISFSTLYGDFEWEIFAFYVAPVDFPFAVVSHPDDDAWGEMVEQFTLASLYNTMLDVTMYDQILTIAVPTNIDPELFYVLQARMLRQITS